MRAFVALTVMVLATIGIGISALAGEGATSSGDTAIVSAAALEAATNAPCWSGPFDLVVSPAIAHPGQVVALDTSGTNGALLESGNFTTFEAQTPQGWAVTYYLSSPASGLGSAWTNYGILQFSPNLAFAGVGTTGLVKVRVPDVAPGIYRFVRLNDAAGQAAEGALGGFPKHGANLCATIRVLPAAPALRSANTIDAAITPATPLHSGERVHVALHGFGSGGKVWLSECAFSDFASSLGCGSELPGQPFVVTSSNGSASTTFVVQSSAQAAPGDHQPDIACSTNCVLVATLGSSYADVEVPLHFARSGSAVGALEMAGGPYPGLARPVPGTVSFVSASGTDYSVRTAENGEFSVILPPGHYRVSGESRQIETNGTPMVCRAADAVSVGAGSTAVAAITCDVP